MYYLSETRITPLTRVRRERRLPAPGELTVGVGERVEPLQVVARTELPGAFRILPVARLLGVPPAKMDRYLRVQPGDEVEEGQVVAARRGLNARTLRSPATGLVTASGGGRVLIETAPEPFELKAYLQGTVTNVLEDYGVVIETLGALVQGIWGAGGEGFGVLRRAVESPESPLEARDVDPSSHGMILVGGAELGEGALELAREFQVRGIVTGGLQAELMAKAAKMPFPIVVTEGIGTVAMSAPAFDLLASHDGREASLSGKARQRQNIVRPELVVPLPAANVPAVGDESEKPLAIGRWVRIVRAPHLGATGTVVALPPRARRIETGARVRGAEVDIGRGAPVFVPISNLEALR